MYSLTLFERCDACSGLMGVAERLWLLFNIVTIIPRYGRTALPLFPLSGVAAYGIDM